MAETISETLADLRKTCAPTNLPAKRTESLRSYFKRNTEDIRTRHQAGASGREVVEALTEQVDRLIQLLFDEVLKDLKVAPPKGFAVLALGGYGRGALNPKSDIDLLFLFHKIHKGDALTRAILHTLWDLRFDVGYSTRTVSDCLTAAQEDFESLTAMLEARFLVGDALLAQRLGNALAGQFLGRRVRSFLAQKVEERRRRHAKAGLSVQLQEPNVKESPGGLRDIHTVGWLLKAKRKRSLPEGLQEERLLSRRNYLLYTNALDFLWRVRNELHFSTGKSNDVLDYDLQPAIAHSLGYTDGNRELAVERFMRDYYLHARNVKHLSDLACERLQGNVSMARRAMGIVVRRVLDDGAILSHTTISLPKKRKGFFQKAPFRLLSLFLDAQRFGAQINETAQQAIKDHLHLIDDEFRQNPRTSQIFLEILRAPAGVASTLRAMHELGVMGAYIPEFDSLTCLVQYNRYHIYTADEHTLVAIENLEHLGAVRGTESGRMPLQKVFNELPRKDLLYLALLLHDVGKSARTEDHSSEGAVMAEAFLKRLGLPDDQADAVRFLVQNHLAMSHISQRRDLADEAMLTEFTRQFKHPDVLRMLYLLTYADLSALIRSAWTAWKAQLLWELYIKAFDLITSGGKPSRGREYHRQAIQTLVDALGNRFASHDLEEHLNNLPPRYAGMNSPDGVATHLELIQQLGKRPVTVNFSRSDLFSEVTICTYDKPYRLSEICGVLATNDINIFSAQAYTRTDGIVLDIFQITGVDGTPAIEPAQQEQVLQQLVEVFQEKVSVEDLFGRHQQRWSRRRKPAIGIPTEIRFENGISNRYTVIDIFAQDAIGLLYKITHTLSNLGLDIYTARISTQADKAVDSFYVTHSGEGKIDTPNERDRIVAELTKQIG